MILKQVFQIIHKIHMIFAKPCCVLYGSVFRGVLPFVAALKFVVFVDFLSLLTTRQPKLLLIKLIIRLSILQGR